MSGDGWSRGTARQVAPRDGMARQKRGEVVARRGGGRLAPAAGLARGRALGGGLSPWFYLLWCGIGQGAVYEPT